MKQRRDLSTNNCNLTLALLDDLLYLRVSGAMDHVEAADAFGELLAMCESTVTFVANLSHMTTHTSAVRKAWVGVALQHRKKFKKIVLIRANALVRMAVAPLVMAGIELSFVDSELAAGLPAGLEQGFA